MKQSIIFARSHGLIFRLITRRFGGFPIKTYSNRIRIDGNVLITYGELWERVRDVYKTCIYSNPILTTKIEFKRSKFQLILVGMGSRTYQKGKVT